MSIDGERRCDVHTTKNDSVLESKKSLDSKLKNGSRWKANNGEFFVNIFHWNKPVSLNLRLSIAIQKANGIRLFWFRALAEFLLMDLVNEVSV